MTAEELAARVRPTPVASFVAGAPEPAAGEPIRLLDLSYGPRGDGIALRAWDFGDGATSIQPKPTHRYARDGAYTVTLHVTARDGRVGVASSVPITVSTHDILLARITAPWRARAGEEARVVVVVEKPASGGDRADRALPATRRARVRSPPGRRHARSRPSAASRCSFTVSFDDDGCRGRARHVRCARDARRRKGRVSP